MQLSMFDSNKVDNLNSYKDQVNKFRLSEDQMTKLKEFDPELEQLLRQYYSLKW